MNNQINNGIGMEALVATLIANYVIKKYSLDTSYFGMLFPVITGICIKMKQYINSEDISFKHLDGINIYYIYAIIMIAFIVQFRDSIFSYYKKREESKYVKINIYKTVEMTTFKNYMNYYPTFFEKVYDLERGNPELISKMMINRENIDNGYITNRAEHCTPKKNIRIKMDDKNLNVKGYCVWQKHEHNEKSKDKEGKEINENINIKYLTIMIEKDMITDIEDYYRQIKHYVRLKQLKEPRIILTFYKSIVRKNNKEKDVIEYHSYNIYDGIKKDLEEKTKLYMDSFFHPEKDRLWHMIKNVGIKNNILKYGQESKISFLLHGPPGTGKSSFAYRVAMCLDRDLFSLDIREIGKKGEVYKAFYKPDLYYGQKKYTNFVYILDEFDLTVKHLYYKDKLLKKYLTKQMSALDDKINGTRVQKIFTNQKEFEEEEEKDGNKTNVVQIKNKMPYFKPELDIDKDSFKLKDLLELFQGAAPMNGLILFATTNEYDKIKKMCPALFRPGRLTPIHFGYIDKYTLQDISKYYFNKKLKIKIPNQLQIPTSKVIQLALECVTLDSGGFKKFEKELDRIL